MATTHASQTLKFNQDESCGIYFCLFVLAQLVVMGRISIERILETPSDIADMVREIGASITALFKGLEDLPTIYMSLRTGLLDIVSEFEDGVDQSGPVKIDVMTMLLNRLIDLAVKVSEQMQEYYRARIDKTPDSQFLTSRKAKLQALESGITSQKRAVRRAFVTPPSAHRASPSKAATQ